MPKLRRISGEEAIRRLEKLDFQRVRQRGSHVVLKKQTSEGEIGCVVPLHWPNLVRVDYHGSKEVPTGTCHSILKASGIKK